jgi:hypothetical protein
MAGSHYAIPCEHAALASLLNSIAAARGTTTVPTHSFLLLQITSTVATEFGIADQNKFFNDALAVLRNARLSPEVIAVTNGPGPPNHKWEYPPPSHPISFKADPAAARSVLLRLQLPDKWERASVAFPSCGKAATHTVALKTLLTEGTSWT